MMKTPNFTFDEAKHLYTLDGKPLTGVTTILGVVAKPALIQWAANEAVKSVKNNVSRFAPSSSMFLMDELDAVLEEAKYAHRKKKESAGDFGTNVHLAIENHIKGIEQPQLTEQENVAFQNFLTWAKNENVTFKESELRLYSRKHWYAGTCDLVMEIGGKTWIGDIKTSSGIYPEYFWQTSAYQLAIQELGLYPEVEGHVIVNVKKDGNVQVERSYGYERNVKAFLACLDIYRIKETLKEEMK